VFQDSKLHSEKMTGGHSSGTFKPTSASLIVKPGAAADALAGAGNIRVLKPGDEMALDSFLARHWLSSMVMRGHRIVGGLVDEGKPHQGTYAAAWESASIVAVAAHYWNGIMAVQAPRALAGVVRAAAAASRRPVDGFVGPWQQAEAAMVAIGRSQRRKLLGHPQALLALDLSKLQIPPPLKKLGVTCRLARADDFEALVPWRVACAIDQMGAKDSPELRASMRVSTENLIAAHRLYIAETASFVGISTIEAATPEALQFDGVWTPPRLRNRGFEAAAAIALVERMRAPNLKHMVMLAPKTNVMLLRTYTAIGFTALGEYGTLIYSDDPK
jgi:uncharacterized protein